LKKHSTAHTEERKKRIGKLADWLSRNELEAAVFLKEDIESTGYNYVYYGGDLAAEEYSAIVVDSSRTTAAIVQEHAYEGVRLSGNFDKVMATRQSMGQLVSNVRTLLESKHYRSVVSDPSSASARASEMLEKVGVTSSKSLTDFVYRERSRKSDYELMEIEKAIKIGKTALERTINDLKIGRSKGEVALELKHALLDEGAAAESFRTDVSLRKGVSEKQLSRIESSCLVLFDFGARLESNYLSDMGRTIPIGSNAPLRDFMSEVIEIKREGLRKITSGETGNVVRSEIDEIIDRAGYASVHRPGHQIGLNVHEPYEPNLAYGEENHKPLEDANVLTWEPGIGEKNSNLPSVRFGMAHMEDMVLVGNHPKMLGNVPLQLW
jgi:Xaa-Pro aminopeptidase